MTGRNPQISVVENVPKAAPETVQTSGVHFFNWHSVAFSDLTGTRAGYIILNDCGFEVATISFEKDASKLVKKMAAESAALIGNAPALYKALKVAEAAIELSIRESAHWMYPTDTQKQIDQRINGNPLLMKVRAALQLAEGGAQ